MQWVRTRLFPEGILDELGPPGRVLRPAADGLLPRTAALWCRRQRQALDDVAASLRSTHAHSEREVRSMAVVDVVYVRWVSNLHADVDPLVCLVVGHDHLVRLILE